MIKAGNEAQPFISSWIHTFLCIINIYAQSNIKSVLGILPFIGKQTGGGVEQTPSRPSQVFAAHLGYHPNGSSVSGNSLHPSPAKPNYCHRPHKLFFPRNRGHFTLMRYLSVTVFFLVLSPL